MRIQKEIEAAEARHLRAVRYRIRVPVEKNKFRRISPTNTLRCKDCGQKLKKEDLVKLFPEWRPQIEKASS